MKRWIELFRRPKANPGDDDTWRTGAFVDRPDDLTPEFHGPHHKALLLTGRPDIAAFGPRLLYNETTDTVGPLPAPGPAPLPTGDVVLRDDLLAKASNTWSNEDRANASKVIIKKLFDLFEET